MLNWLFKARRMRGDARAAGRPEDALAPVMAAISATTAPHVLLVEEGVALPRETASTLPVPLRLGPVDGWLIAAALGALPAVLDEAGAAGVDVLPPIRVSLD